MRRLDVHTKDAISCIFGSEPPTVAKLLGIQIVHMLRGSLEHVKYTLNDGMVCGVVRLGKIVEHLSGRDTCRPTQSLSLRRDGSLIRASPYFAHIEGVRRQRMIRTLLVCASIRFGVLLLQGSL